MAALGMDFFVQTFAATLQKYETKLVDQVLTTNPVLELFKGKFTSKTGRGLVIPIRAAKLAQTGYTDAAGTASNAVSPDTIGSAVYGWADTIITPWRLNYEEILQNQGKEQIVDLVNAYVTGATQDHQDFIAAELHTLGSAWTAGSLLSLDALVGDATSDAASVGLAANPVGGIDPTDPTKVYWQSTRKYIPTTGTGSKDIIAAFRETVNAIYVASRKRPNVCVAGLDVYEEIEAFLQSNSQWQNVGGTAETRFTELKFGGLNVRLDPDCQVDRAYFLNTDSWVGGSCAGEFMKVHEKIPVTNVLYGGNTNNVTLDVVTPIASKLQIGVNERRANGVLIRQAAGS